MDDTNHGIECGCFVCSPEFMEAFLSFRSGAPEEDASKMIGEYYYKYLQRTCTIDKIALPLEEHIKWARSTEGGQNAG